MNLEKPIPAGRLVLRKDACAIVGLPPDTVGKWLRKGLFKLPPGPTFAGRDLWSAQDIERLRLFAELWRPKVGRPKVVRDPARIAALRLQGLSWKRVAIELGISVKTAIKILRDREVA